MPLPSLLKGAKQCQVLTRRTKQRCKNPAAYGCRSCRMHGAHKSRNVLNGVDHPRYKNGERSKAIEAEIRKKSILLRYLVDVGNHVELFYKKLKSKGRPPLGYTQLNLDDPEQLALAILTAITKKI
jgi:hypothetical protein